MSSYQPVSIPASQNPYPSLPYSQNFPDEPDSQLQVPLNNPPQHYDPPQNLYPQQPVPIPYPSQPGQFYGVPQGYNQQAPQYMVVPIDPERRQMDMKVSDLDKKLDNGWYFVYKVWLYICIGCSILGIFHLLTNLILVANIIKFEGTVSVIFFGGIFLFYMSLPAWTLHFSLVFKNAMNGKNLKGARRGLKSMIAYSVYSLIIFIALIVLIDKVVRPSLAEELRRESWASYYVQALVFLYAIPTFLQLFGAKKVIEVLVERDIVVGELKTRYGDNLV